MSDDIKPTNKLDILYIFKTSFSYWKNDAKSINMFTLINFLFFVVGIFVVGSPSNPLFLVWVVFYYIFWSYFFRYVFDKKPYYQMKVLANSVLPSAKVLIMTILSLSLILSLPWILSWLAIPFMSEWLFNFMDMYVQFLEKDKDGVELLLSFIFIFLAPIIFYRPFYAWISSTIGRGDSIKFAYNKTKGNYWQFLMLGIIMNASWVVIKSLTIFVCNLIPLIGNEEIFRNLVLFAVASPLIVYYNIYLAKSYEFFFDK